MMLKLVTISLCFACFLMISGAPSALAQQPKERASAEAAIRQAGKDYLAAIEKGDPQAIAAFWTADGTYSDEDGQTFKSRELIEKGFVEKQAIRPKIHLSDVEIRFLTPDVAIQEGKCLVTPHLGAPVAGHFMAVWVHRDNGWKLASLKESSADDTLTPDERLAALDIFVGNWSGQSDKIKLQVSAKWNAGKTYLHREFVASADGKEVFHGSQVIGWDPILHEIHSWTFNEDGGFAESVWSLEGHVWMVASTNVKPDGQTAKTTQTFKFSGKDKMLWKLKNMTDDVPKTVLEIELTRNK